MPAWLTCADFAVFVLLGREDCVLVLLAWLAPVVSILILPGKVDCAVCSMPAWLSNVSGRVVARCGVSLNIRFAMLTCQRCVATAHLAGPRCGV